MARIEHWDPEDAGFWESKGKRIANRSQIFSIATQPPLPPGQGLCVDPRLVSELPTGPSARYPAANSLEPLFP